MADFFGIRSATPDDAQQLLNIYSYYVLNTAISFEITVPTLDEFTNRITKTLKKYPYIVAVQGDKILGYAYAGPFVGREAYDHCAELTIYLAPDVTKRGIGRVLYENLEKELMDMGIKNLYACIGDPETEDEYLTKNSEQFHQHMGFRKVGTFTKCGYKFGRWYNMIWMEKFVEESNMPEKKFSIRLTTKDEFRKVRRFYLSLIDSMEKMPYRPKWIKDVYPSPEYLMNAIENKELFIGLENDEIACAMILNSRYVDDYNKIHWKVNASGNEVLVVHTLGVHYDFNGKGYGKALVRYAIDYGRKTGRKVVRLDVLKGNVSAENLYPSVGFKEIETIPVHYENMGTDDFIMYEYEL